MKMYLRKTYILLSLFFAFFVTKAFAIGDSGAYYIQGVAYGTNNVLLQNTELTIMIGYRKSTIKTSTVGQFEIEVNWETACATNNSKKTSKELNEQLNPEYIIVKYADKKILIKNEWEKYASIFPRTKDKMTMIKDLNFLTDTSAFENKNNDTLINKTSQAVFNLFIDGDNEGWCFVDIKVDSTSFIDEKNNTLYLNNNRKRSVMKYSGKEPFHFKVIAINSNTDITGKMKLPSITGDFKTYYQFNFYNPGKSVYPDQYFIRTNGKASFLDSLDRVKRKLNTH